MRDEGKTPELDQTFRTYIDYIEYMGEMVAHEFQYDRLNGDDEEPRVRIEAIMMGGWGSSTNVMQHLSEDNQQSWCSEIETAIKEENERLCNVWNRAQCKADDEYSDGV